MIKSSTNLRHTSEWKREREKNNGSIYYDFEDKPEQIVYIRAAGYPLHFYAAPTFYSTHILL